MTKTEKQERRLVRRAAAALVALSEFREKHSAVADITVSAQINGWPEPQAREIARLMLAAGVTAVQARHLFAAAARVRQ